ncbi:MAG: CpsD/CapB family tyrosine-protein kinase [Chloroflexi bacterium]|nr:CpsD/CapB family tyrosine-protein kinase [Chloroflexota bacterium]
MTHLITLTHPRSQAAEAFRTLRTNLTFSSLESPLTTLLVTSPSDDGDVESGKSITLANLAITFAQGGKKTILVDCDLRRPAQHELWNVKNDRGLSEFIQEGGDPVLQSVNVEGLLLLTSGAMPPAPADLISSSKMEKAIAILKSKADIVLFDAPPVIAVTDAALLASKLDGVLLVVSAGHTKRDHAAQAKELLEKIKVRIVGTVLTNAPMDASVKSY